MAQCFFFLIISFPFDREMLGDQRFLNFVKQNPQIKFQTELKGARHPILIGEYSEFSIMLSKGKESTLIYDSYE
jgi:large subunit ribosomal protein L43